ncbi:hypothetical protein NMY22_g10494 [Coprinellus aureogranulatus]|nr:hypothetical protein NMY22_g10494 [Coprinellus aureogranulatus]
MASNLRSQRLSPLKGALENQHTAHALTVTTPAASSVQTPEVGYSQVDKSLNGFEFTFNVPSPIGGRSLPRGEEQVTGDKGDASTSSSAPSREKDNELPKGEAELSSLEYRSADKETGLFSGVSSDTTSAEPNVQSDFGDWSGFDVGAALKNEADNLIDELEKLVARRKEPGYKKTPKDEYIVMGLAMISTTYGMTPEDIKACYSKETAERLAAIESQTTPFDSTQFDFEASLNPDAPDSTPATNDTPLYWGFEVPLNDSTSTSHGVDDFWAIECTSYPTFEEISSEEHPPASTVAEERAPDEAPKAQPQVLQDRKPAPAETAKVSSTPTTNNASNAKSTPTTKATNGLRVVTLGTRSLPARRPAWGCTNKSTSSVNTSTAKPQAPATSASSSRVLKEHSTSVVKTAATGAEAPSSAVDTSAVTPQPPALPGSSSRASDSSTSTVNIPSANTQAPATTGSSSQVTTSAVDVSVNTAEAPTVLETPFQDLGELNTLEIDTLDSTPQPPALPSPQIPGGSTSVVHLPAAIPQAPAVPRPISDNTYTIADPGRVNYGAVWVRCIWGRVKEGCGEVLLANAESVQRHFESRHAGEMQGRHSVACKGWRKVADPCKPIPLSTLGRHMLEVHLSPDAGSRTCQRCWEHAQVKNLTTWCNNCFREWATKEEKDEMKELEREIKAANKRNRRSQRVTGSTV